MYRAGKWTKSKIDPDSRFYADNPINENQGNLDKDTNERNTSGVGAEEGRGLGSGHRCGRGHRGARGGRGRGRGFQRKRCYKCGIEGHVEHNYWVQGGGYEVERPSFFSGVNDAPVDATTPPGKGNPRERTLLDGTEVKWCILYAEWGNHTVQVIRTQQYHQHSDYDEF